MNNDRHSSAGVKNRDYFFWDLLMSRFCLARLGSRKITSSFLFRADLTFSFFPLSCQVYKQQTTKRQPIECAPEASRGGREWAEMTERFHLQATRRQT